MPVTIINIAEFLARSSHAVVLDVRSPGEYSHAQIPGAVNLPLFSDEERKTVGTLYKQTSREAAVKAGLDFFGVKMRLMVEKVEALLQTTPAGNGTPLIMHCWRGGMRSAAVAWLLDVYGFKVSMVRGGYKAYRKHIQSLFEKEYPAIIIGGYTGSGKTKLLHELRKHDHAVIDLEALGNHKGSALGGINMDAQPSQEQFENLLGTALMKVADAKHFFLEDESQRLGNLQIPMVFWQQLRNKPVYFFDIPFDQRLEYLLIEYGNLPADKLIDAVGRIRKRLGGLEAKHTTGFLEANDLRGAYAILLRYYDKYYEKALANRPPEHAAIVKISAADTNAEVNYRLLEELLNGHQKH